MSVITEYRRWRKVCWYRKWKPGAKAKPQTPGTLTEVRTGIPDQSFQDDYLVPAAPALGT